MSKSTKANTSKTTSTRDANVSKAADAPLSDAVLAAALQAIKPTARTATSEQAKTTTTTAAQSKAKTAVVNRSTPGKASTAHHPPSQELIDKMVEEAAYYLAEKRNFAPGFEEQDWLAAKEQIKRQLAGTDNPLK